LRSVPDIKFMSALVAVNRGLNIQRESVRTVLLPKMKTIRKQLQNPNTYHM
jgi:hypothetical protein